MMIDPGFGIPNGEAPALCLLIDPTRVEELQNLIDETTEQLSYERFLQDRLSEVCGESAMSFIGIRDGLQQQLDEARNTKQSIYQDLFQQLAPQGTFLEDYITSLETDFEMARDSLEDRSAITVTQPEFLDTCDPVVMPIKEEIDSLLAELNNEIDCIAYTRDTVCSELAGRVVTLMQDNADLLMTLQEQINGLLDDLIAAEGTELDRGTFDLELQALFDNDPERPMMSSSIVLPAEAVPETCADTVTFDEIQFIQSISERMMNYEKWLMNRLAQECGESATELEQINSDLQVQLQEAQDDKDECIADFFALLGEEEQTLEQYTEAW